jgi:hypothetical protein
MSDAYWDSIKEEKLELIKNMKTLCKETGLTMPDVNEKMRIEIIHQSFDLLKEQYWDNLKKLITQNKINNKE